ncbi:hypothetical protein TKK_0007776 [Trichogramma kaykai]|uniref:Uncharacterized protein n=1 Tax=Trichogramma kaykai TaxID=54128 RepID=A0ABD2X753_9HYME
MSHSSHHCNSRPSGNIEDVVGGAATKTHYCNGYPSGQAKLPRFLANNSPRNFDFDILDLRTSSCVSQLSSPYYTKYLEGKMVTLQEQVKKILIDNTALKNQVKLMRARNQELEEKSIEPEDPERVVTKQKYDRYTSMFEISSQQSNEKTNVDMIPTREMHDVSTSVDLVEPRNDFAAQTTLSDEQKQQPIECCDNSANSVSISKSDLLSLEKDARALRDVVRAKEELWNQALEREQSYRKILARLSVDLLTARQLADNRSDEIQALAQKLAERERPLKASRRELSTLKKVPQKSKNVKGIKEL